MQDEYRMEEENGTGSFMVGVLCGAAIGAAIGLMFAPKAGTEMRRQIADQTGRFRRRATEQADRLRRRAGDAYNDASQTINDVVSRGRDALDAGREAFQRAKPNGAPGSSIS